eukprot:TRINITY_DN7134_c0_g1_i1.p1 TRINITY_DN7134_c0_g1~~TRINITY_DN7134_c0_g1_i1.p1  ORF type:complete len:361 (-),score=29.80 TRINITY_DN7134_c0_g1_i1:87-1169(-)
MVLSGSSDSHNFTGLAYQDDDEDASWAGLLTTLASTVFCVGQAVALAPLAHIAMRMAVSPTYTPPPLTLNLVTQRPPTVVNKLPGHPAVWAVSTFSQSVLEFIAYPLAEAVFNNMWQRYDPLLVPESPAINADYDPMDPEPFVWDNVNGNLYCRLISAILASFVVRPLSLARNRMVAQPYGAPYKYTGFFQTIRRTYREEGVRPFLNALVPNTVAFVAGSIISNVIERNRNFLMKLFTKHYPTKNKTVLTVAHATFNTITALSEACIPVILTRPFIVVTTRMDMLGTGFENQLGMPSGVRYTSWIHCATHMLRTEGFSSFYRGYTYELARDTLILGLGTFVVDVIMARYGCWRFKTHLDW